MITPESDIVARNACDTLAKPPIYHVGKAAVEHCQKGRAFTCHCNLGGTEDNDSANEHKSHLVAAPEAQSCTITACRLKCMLESILCFSETVT